MATQLDFSATANGRGTSVHSVKQSSWNASIAILGPVVDVVKSVSMASEHGKAIVSESLLAKIPEKHPKDAHKCFKLGLDDWTESSSEEGSEKENQAQKKLKLTLNKEGNGEQSSCWHFVDNEENHFP